MTVDILRAELERLFELEELLTLSRELLGFDPEQVGGTRALGSFAGALTQHCLETDAVEALCDAVLASKSEVNPAVAQLRTLGPEFDDALRAGDTLGPFTLSRSLGQGRIGVSYQATRDGQQFRLKVLSRAAARDKAGLQQFLTVNRIVGTTRHPGLPERLEVGQASDRVYIAHATVEGQDLAARLSRSGPMHINEARALVTGILEALAALHDRHVAHGDLRPQNVIVTRTAQGETVPVLLDAGTDRFRSRVRAANGQTELLTTAISPHTASPEQIRGVPADARSDVYAFGALLYNILTGKPLFDGRAPCEVAFAQLAQDAVAPSKSAPRGWIADALDDFVLSLLAKDPRKRPKDAAAVLAGLEDVLLRVTSRQGAISDQEVDSLVDALIADPKDTEAALKLEGAISQGAAAVRVAEAFALAAEALDTEDAEQCDAARSLLMRAGRLFERQAKDLARAEVAYGQAVALDAKDRAAGAALVEVKKQLGKYEEVIETLLAQSDEAQGGAERARAIAEIGRLYAHELEDPDQAVVAFAQALCSDPNNDAHAQEIERLSGTNQERWGEVLSACAELLGSADLANDTKNTLLNRVGGWYVDKVSRSDLALPCFKAVIGTDPANLRALAGMASIYRKAKQWAELGMVLGRWSDAAPTPAKSRDMRAESAELLEFQLNDPGAARKLYEQIFDEDPSHAKASEALARIYEKAADYAGVTKILERRAEALHGEEKARVQCRLAELYEDRLDDLDAAIKQYSTVLAADSQNLDALRGLDRIYSKTGRFTELLDNLAAQLSAAATPRQQITLLERIAAIYDEEFLDHGKAAETWERVLRVDNAHENALTALARHYRVLDRWEEVASVYARHLKLVTDRDRQIDLALACGRVLAEHIGSPERATAAYERVLEYDPEHPLALEALARLRESSGDADAALEAIDTLAAKAQSPEARAEQYVRAARLLEARGDRDGAIERYKQALDANPKDAGVGTALRGAYLARGDVNAALKLLEREIEHTDGERAKAKLAGEMALLARDRIKDDARAAEAARRAITFDPTNLPGNTVLGDIAFEANRFLEASKHYEVLADRAGSLPTDEAARILIRYVDALRKSGSTEKALVAMDTLLRVAPNDAHALERVAFVTFDAGSPKRAVELYKDFLDRFGASLDSDERSTNLYRYGEALRRAGQLEEAVKPLEEAADFGSADAAPLVALSKIYEARESWKDVIRWKTRHLDIADGDMRVQLLMEMGDLASAKLNDRALATRNFVAALEERPDDRKLLMKLMQLYSEEKEWSRLIEIVLRLAEGVEDPKQKVKYLHTAAIVSSRQMEDLPQALGFYEQVLELDPGFEKARIEALELYTHLKDFTNVERLLKQRVTRAIEAKDEKVMLETFTTLGELYEKELGRIDKAIDAHEAAQALDGDNRERALHLSELYASNPSKYLEKAVASQAHILRENPYRHESYQLLRRLYTETKQADAAWCLCQAMYVMKLAEPDEERFFTRMRSDTAAPAQQAMVDEDWLGLMHVDAEPLLTSLFALIEPVVIAKRGTSLAELGYDRNYAIDLASHPALLSQNLHFSASVLGLSTPATYENPNDPGGLMFLHAHEPSIVLGQAGIYADVPPQPAAFIAARHLTYFRPGMYLRQLIPTLIGLKAWLFGAIKLIAPQFPVAADFEGPVKEALGALEAGLTGTPRDHLARVVSRLIQSGAALDLKRWVAGVDLTADRAGLVVCHDLETAVEVIRASDDAAAAVPLEERVKELLLYSVSQPYFEIRHKLEIAIDS